MSMRVTEREHNGYPCNGAQAHSGREALRLPRCACELHRRGLGRIAEYNGQRRRLGGASPHR